MAPRLLLGIALFVAACNTSTASAAPPAPPRGATVKGLRAEIVPVIGGLFPTSPADPNGKPVATTWTLRITNTTDAPIVFRTGGDDESFDIKVRGAGVASAKVNAPCPEIYFYGRKNVIPAKGHLDVPVHHLASGARCSETSHYLTAPGLYSIDVSLNGHIHPSSAMSTGDRGDSVRLEAPTINVRAS
jgi:hypothetical protein